MDQLLFLSLHDNNPSDLKCLATGGQGDPFRPGFVLLDSAFQES